MFKMHAVNAFFGDALLLEYGTAADPHFLLVDGDRRIHGRAISSQCCAT